MARPNKPWFRESKGTWYCTVDGKKVSLKVQGRENEAEAIQAWHRLCATGSPDPAPPPALKPSLNPSGPGAGGVTVGDVLTAFLTDSEVRVKSKTLKSYRYFLLPFLDIHGRLTVDTLAPTLAEAYSRKPDWSPQTRHGFLGTLVTAFRWAIRARVVDHNPLTGLCKPPKASRGMEAVLTPEEYARLLNAANPAFRMFLRVLYATGARPGEVAGITAENFDAEAGVIRLPAVSSAW